MNIKRFSALLASALAAVSACAFALDDSALARYVQKFNADDVELYKESFPNSVALDFLKKNVPLFDCPDKNIEATYYFRWWTFRKHIKTTEDGYVITEFMPKVGWSGKHNTICCPAAHHMREARWLAQPEIVADYAKFWLTKSNTPRAYSTWYADSILNIYKVNPDANLLKELYEPLKKNLAEWEKTNLDPECGLFWIIDSRDGMEISISGALNAGWRGYRTTINSYMYSEYAALSQMAKILGKDDESSAFAKKAEVLKNLINKKLWDAKDNFYKVIPKNGDGGEFSPARELHGYTPWYFGIAPAEYDAAWRQIADENGFKSPFGLTSAERRSPLFSISYIGHECQWNGPVWPFSTSVTLTALANLLNERTQNFIDKSDYFDALATYAKSQRRTLENGTEVFWIDENQNPFTGDWISRTRLSKWEKGTWSKSMGGTERGKDYNHSTFADLIITGLVGVRPQLDGSAIINPLTPDDWRYFCLDNLPCKGHRLTVLFDADGTRYNKGAGFMVFIDGKLAKRSPKVESVRIEF